MHIALLGPTHKSFIKSFLNNYDENDLPDGYFGAPFMGIIISELLKQGNQVTAITTTECLNEDYVIQEFSMGNFTWVLVPARQRPFALNGNKLSRQFDFKKY